MVEWLRQKAIEAIEQPLYLLDFNPIPSIWAILNYRLHEWYSGLEHTSGGPSTVKVSIEQAAIYHRNSLDPELFEKLAKEMPKGVQAVIKAKGWRHTRVLILYFIPQSYSYHFIYFL